MARRRRSNVAETAPLATWRVHLLAASGARGAVAVLAVATALALVVAVLGTNLLTLALAAAFLWSLGDFLLPCDYTVTTNEVVATTPISEKRMSWNQVRGYAEASGGILLTTLRRRTLLDRFRGMFLHVTPEHRERVVELVKGLTRNPARS
jgi:hypothetical protein